MLNNIYLAVPDGVQPLRARLSVGPVLNTAAFNRALADKHLKQNQQSQIMDQWTDFKN